MIRRYVLVVTVVFISACATSGPQATEAVADVGSPVTSSNPAAEQQLEVAEVPEVAVSANIPAPAREFCRRETEIGSRRVKRVCRTQAEMDLAQEEAKQTLDELQRMRDVRKSLDELQ